MRAPAPHPSLRLIPSRFPPIGLFDTVATAADLPAVMELAGWTDDRLVTERLGRLPRGEWVHGRANSSIVMAAFLHAAPSGQRFSGPELGAWYAAGALATAAFEVGHHLRREAAASGLEGLSRQYRAYAARLDGAFLDLRGAQAELPAIYDPGSHAASQAYGEAARARGEHGILYDSLRHPGGVCAVAFRPSRILDVMQGDHFSLSVRAGERRMKLTRLA